MTTKTDAEIRSARRRTPKTVGDLTVAALWPKFQENLGTLLRTCDAVGADLVVPRLSRAVQNLHKGNTLGMHNSPYTLIEDRDAWLVEAAATTRLVGVELAHNSQPLYLMEPVGETPMTILIGNETSGIPEEALELCDEIVEIPMIGVGNSLNVAVAASLVLYRARGWV